MTELLWQTLLLLGAAFFCGAVLACGLKRRFYYGRSGIAVPAAAAAVTGSPTTPDASQPMIEVAPRAAGDGERFGRALSGQVAAPAQPAAPAPAPTPAAAAVAPKPAEPASAPAPAAPEPAAPPAAAAPSPAAPAPAAPEPPAPAAPAPVAAAPAKPAEPEPVKPAEPAPPPAAQPAAAASMPEMAAGIPRVSVSTGSGAPVKTEEGGAGPSDDLTRIRGIDSPMAQRLKDVGIRRFQDLAKLTTKDIKGLSESLGLDARISLDNWVSQAVVLAGGGATNYSRRVDEGVPLPENAEPSAPVVATPAAAAEPASPTAAEPAPPPAAPEPPPAAPAPAPAATTPAPAAAPAPAPAADNDAAPPADVAHLRSVRSEALLGEEGARAAANRRTSDVDDLKRIRGIGVLIEKKLNSLGILSYEQVANWTGADIERISRILDFKGRIEREHWIEQARILATGGQTEFSRRGDR